MEAEQDGHGQEQTDPRVPEGLEEAHGPYEEGLDEPRLAVAVNIRM